MTAHAQDLPDDAPTSERRPRFMAEPVAAASCWTLDAHALARCPRLTRAQRRVLDGLVSDETHRRADLDELLATIARARSASERAGNVAVSARPDPIEDARAVLPALQAAAAKGSRAEVQAAVAALTRALGAKT